MRIEKKTGKYSENQARKYLKRGIPFILLYVVFFLVSQIDYSPFYINFGKYTAGINFIGGTVFMYGIMQFLEPFSNWKSGLNGEKRVVKNLSEKLNDKYSIFNDVLLRDGKRGGNIDHIIIGPTGIFVIETKNNQGKITYDQYGWKGIGGKHDPTSQVNQNMFKVKDVMKNCEVFKNKELYLRQIVVLSNPRAKPEIVNLPVYGCKIVWFKSIDDPVLADFILNQKVCFSDEEILQIEQCLQSFIRN